MKPSRPSNRQPGATSWTKTDTRRPIPRTGKTRKRIRSRHRSRSTRRQPKLRSLARACPAQQACNRSWCRRPHRSCWRPPTWSPTPGRANVCLRRPRPVMDPNQFVRRFLTVTDRVVPKSLLAELEVIIFLKALNLAFSHKLKSSRFNLFNERLFSRTHMTEGPFA